MRALVVDHNDAFRTLVAVVLRECADVVEQAADGEIALRLAQELRPDLIVMDISMPRMDGVSAARAILARQPVGCVNSIACAKTADLQAEPTLRTPQASTIFRLTCGTALRMRWCPRWSGMSCFARLAARSRGCCGKQLMSASWLRRPNPSYARSQRAGITETGEGASPTLKLAPRSQAASRPAALP